jgi:hypothetical protein
MQIGRDHIASTVDTLVLAYVGASLPLLIVFTVADRRISDVLTSEVVASEIVRTLVGSIGLVASVPLTTGLAAAVVASGAPPSGPAGPRRRVPSWRSLRGFAVRAIRPVRVRAQRRRAAWQPSRAEREFRDDA